MTNKIIKILLLLPVFAVSLLIIVINFRLYYSPDIEIQNTDTVNVDMVRQLRGLKYLLDNHRDRDMQQLYPEGFIFTNALYALAWCNFIESLDHKSEYVKEGASEIQKAFDKMNSDEGREPFSEYLPIPFGAFYSGWTTYVLGRKLSLEAIGKRDTIEVNYFKKQCVLIARELDKHVYPVSYPENSWPADAVLCVAALSLHDRLYPARHTESIDHWLNKVKSNLDPLGLIPHAAEPNGKSTENARGSSQGLMLLFLREIDESFALQQFKIYKDNFLDEKLGLVGIREYPANDFGIGDVDSGPMFLQMGASATLVGMQTLHLYGAHSEGTRVRRAAEAFGFSHEKNGDKTYLLGMLPIADAFIAWSDSTDSLNKSGGRFYFISYL